MHLSRRTLAASLAASLIAPPGYAAEPATPEEAKVLAEKAAEHMKLVGPEKAIADFSDANAGYVDRELFVVVYGPDNRVASSDGVPVLRGQDATTLKEVDGKEFGKESIALAKSAGSGWSEYRMTTPVTKKVGLKASWVVRVGDYILFVGAFKG